MVQIYANQIRNINGRSVGVFTQISTDNNCHTLISSLRGSVEIPFKLLSIEEWKDRKNLDYMEKHVEEINKVLKEKMNCIEQIDIGEFAGTVLVQLLMKIDLDKIDWAKQTFGKK